MEKVLFIISIVSLAVALIMFIGRVLTYGVAKTFEWKSRPSKVMLCSLLIYVVSFGVYILMEG